VPSRLLSLVLLTVLALLSSALSQGAAARSGADCGAKSVLSSLPAPAPEEGYKVEVVINQDCSLVSGPVQAMNQQEVASAAHSERDASAASGEGRRPFSRIGSTKQHLDPDYHMDSHLWDCCNALLTHLVTDLNWTDDGSVITGWNAGGYTGQHPEFGTCGPGWQLANSYLIQNSGGTGQSSIEVKAHAEWSYLGLFDCSGTTYYNIFEHFVTGRGNGATDCWSYVYLRHTYPGFHLQVQCYNPTWTINDTYF
jgi:hypothetical protein